MENLIWHTEKRIINDLIPFEMNPRQMTEKQVNDLRKSLEKFNLVEIPAVDTDNRIIAGHQRLRIMQLLNRGDEEIDVRMPNRKLTDAEFKEYNLRSNKNTGEWDSDMLVNFDETLLIDAGFTSEELDDIFGLETDEDDFDADKEYQAITEAQTKLGDIYKLGNNRLMCGDSTKKEDVEKLMDSNISKLIFTSPPYNMAGKMYENYKDNLKSDEYINFNLNVIDNYKHFLKGFLFWNISYNKNARWEFIEILYKIVKETGLKFLELIVWDKKHGLPIISKEMMTRQYEDILVMGDEDTITQDLELFYCGRNDKRAYFNKKTQKGLTNYWGIGTNKTQLENHLACYPVELPSRAITIMTQRDDIIIDPFLGSGSTMIACEKLNRKCFGMELDPKYVDVAIKRWEKLTGQHAEKLN